MAGRAEFATVLSPRRFAIASIAEFDNLEIAHDRHDPSRLGCVAKLRFSNAPITIPENPVQSRTDTPRAIALPWFHFTRVQ